DLVLQPELAERWEVSSDARKFTFTLRKGLHFANIAPVNGRDITSTDVKFSYDYWSRTGEFKDKKLAPGQNAAMFEGLERVDAPDPSAVVVTFKDPFVPFLNYAASSWNHVVPREIYDQDGSYRDRILGSGPYQLDTGASQK